MRKRILLFIPLLFISLISRASFGLEQIGEALITFSLLLAALPFVVGGLAVLLAKKNKGRAFFIGFGITTLILLIWIFSGSSAE
jgi:hypothetical protein